MNYVTKRVIISFLIFVSLKGFSQVESEKPFRAKHYVYHNSGAILNLPSGFQLGYERRIAPKLYFDIEGGVLLFNENIRILDFNATDKKGVRFQTGGKVFLTDYFFIGPQFLFKRVSLNELEWVWRFNNAFRQRFDIHKIRKTFAAATEVGWHFPFEESPISLELCYALGVQRYMVEFRELPDDVEFIFNQGIRTPGVSTLPFFNFRIKLKYDLEYKWN